MKRSVVVVSTLSLLLWSALALCVVDEGRCEGDCRVVRIQGMVTHDSVRLEPETIQVPKGTCVIWLTGRQPMR